MKYPVGHPECIIGPSLRNRDISDFEGVARCTVLPPKSLYLPLLPCRISDKLMFVLCYRCALNKQQTPCRHSDKARAITSTWVTDELKKAVEIGYRILRIHEIWNYKNTTQYNPDDGSGGLFAEYMNAFIGLKMEASGYPNYVVTDEEKKAFVENIRVNEGVTLNVESIMPNPGKRAVAKLCLNVSVII